MSGGVAVIGEMAFRLARSPLRKLVPASLKRPIVRAMLKNTYESLIVGGGIESTIGLSPTRRRLASSHFQHREKADVAMAAATSWYGGDYFEFGARDLNTFRNFLSAFHIAGLDEPFPDTRFYAFDVFGDLSSQDEKTAKTMRDFDSRTSYFSQQFPRGDDLPRHQRLLAEHGLFVDRCELVQGFFADTLTPARAAAYKAEGREIGFAFIDCNFEEFYREVFAFIFPLLAANAYIYLDEGLQSSQVLTCFEQFDAALRERRGIGCAPVRPAGAFGILYRVYPLRPNLPPLQLPV